MRCQMSDRDTAPSAAHEAKTPDQFTIETPQGERITYRASQRYNDPGEWAGYWSATQEGMPDAWGLSRVASRGISALESALSELASLRSALATAQDLCSRWIQSALK